MKGVEAPIIFIIGTLTLLVFVLFLFRFLLVVNIVRKERKKSEALLLNILPKKIAERLKMKEQPIADSFKEVSILFIDMVGFTKFTENRDPKEVVSTLNDVFSKFDDLAEKHGLEKIKTIGDCYMAAAGIPEPHADHAQVAAAMALDVKDIMKGYTTAEGTPLHFKMGLDCGSVVAGVIGKKKFIYDLWGDAVNTASRMEATGVMGEVHCTDIYKTSLEHSGGYIFINRGAIEVKGKGMMETWLMRRG